MCCILHHSISNGNVGNSLRWWLHYILFGTIDKSTVYSACLSVDEQPQYTHTLWELNWQKPLLVGFVHGASIALNLQRKQTREPDLIKHFRYINQLNYFSIRFSRCGYTPFHASICKLRLNFASVFVANNKKFKPIKLTGFREPHCFHLIWNSRHACAIFGWGELKRVQQEVKRYSIMLLV